MLYEMMREVSYFSIFLCLCVEEKKNEENAFGEEEEEIKDQ